MVQTIIVDMEATSLRPGGGVSFVPYRHRDTLQRLKSLIERELPAGSCESSMRGALLHLPVIDRPATRARMARVVHQALMGEVGTLQKDLERFLEQAQSKANEGRPAAFRRTLHRRRAACHQTSLKGRAQPEPNRRPRQPRQACRSFSVARGFRSPGPATPPDVRPDKQSTRPLQPVPSVDRARGRARRQAAREVRAGGDRPKLNERFGQDRTSYTVIQRLKRRRKARLDARLQPPRPGPHLRRRPPHNCLPLIQPGLLVGRRWSGRGRPRGLAFTAQPLETFVLTHSSAVRCEKVPESHH
jgi:hypothetical protein